MRFSNRALILFLIFSITLGLSMSVRTENAEAVPIFVSITGRLEGILSYINVSEMKPEAGYLKISSVWENIGSVGCKVAVRLDIYNRSSMLFTSWSKSRVVAPGNVATFENYWFFGNMSGNFTAVVRVYYCDEIQKLENMSIAVPEHNLSYGVERINASSWVWKEDATKIHVVFDREINSTELIVLPLENPIGTRVYADRLINTTAKQLELEWKYEFLREYEIPLAIIDLQAHRVYYAKILTTPEAMPKKKSPAVLVSILIFALLLAVFGRALKKKRKSRKRGKQSKKKNRFLVIFFSS